MEEKRLFFGLSVESPWPQRLPAGRLLDQAQRHLTLAFLGNIDFEVLKPLLPQCPPLPFKVGLTGFFDKILFLPERHPNVVAWHLKALEDFEPLLSYQKSLVRWLIEIGLPPAQAEREFLPHLTISRKPFDIKQWKKAFAPLPFQTHSFHLFESVGNLQYVPLWTSPVTPAFEELEHTADIAFILYGKDVNQIYMHAQVALAWKFPPILKYISLSNTVSSLDDIVANLNKLITLADSNEGCPLKAVSYHGEINEHAPNILKWEMIVDV